MSCPRYPLSQRTKVILYQAALACKLEPWSKNILTTGNAVIRTLFFTTFAAVFIWLWGLGAYYIIKWFNQKEIPGIHKPLSGSVAKQTGLDSLPLLGGSEHKDQANGEPEKPHRGEGVKKKERKSAGGATGDSDGPTPPQQQQQQHHHQHHGGGGHAARKGETDGEEEKENKPPPLTTPTKKVGSVAKSTGETGDVAGHVGDAKKKVGGVTGAVGVQV